MHEILSEIKFDNVLSVDTGSVDNWEEYIEYLNGAMYDLAGEADKKLNYHSDKFGDLKIILYIDQPLDEDNGEFEIRIKINDSRDNFNEDDWYDGLADDVQFINFLENQLVQYINELNSTFNHIQFPKNEELIYKDESLYMRISPINYKHTPEFVPFTIDTTVDRDQLFDNIWVN